MKCGSWLRDALGLTLEILAILIFLVILLPSVVVFSTPSVHLSEPHVSQLKQFWKEWSSTIALMLFMLGVMVGIALLDYTGCAR